MNKKILFCLLFITLSVSLFAQDETGETAAAGLLVNRYDMGNTMLSVKVAWFIPLFVSDTNGNISALSAVSYGISGGIDFGFFFHKFFMLGIQLSGEVASNPTKLFTMVPLTLKPTFNLSFNRFDLQTSLGLGIAGVSLANSGGNALFILKPGVVFYYMITPKISLGLNAEYWWLPEIYSGPKPPADESRFGNFMDLGLSIRFSL